MDFEKVVEKHVLQNALKYEGKANPGAVVGSVIGEVPDAKKDMKKTMQVIHQVVGKINKLSLKEQTALAEKSYPELFEKKEKEERDLFAFLNIPSGEQIRTAFPPGPEKYPHIGHAKAMIVNEELAKKYKGEFYLRFEDTNPELVKKEFYEIMLENFAWLGVKWQHLDYASDFMDLFYKHARELIDKDQAYVCFCSQETMKQNRETGSACKCRAVIPKENMANFEKMFKAKEGTCILRMKIDLEHKNSTMRDPVLMRIIAASHARQGKKYRIWPSYDFQNSIMDGHLGITHRLRSKEFELRNELQRHIQNSLGYKETSIYEFARFNLEGVESSGRIIRDKIAKKELTGWDDPSLSTLVALRRRGFMPEAIRSFVLSTGITKSESTLTWDDLIVHNRRVLDKESNRYFFIEKPAKITIVGAPEQEVELKLHPEDAQRGKRILKTNEQFYVEEKDAEQFKEGELIRLMDCLNFKKAGKALTFDSLEYEQYKGKGKQIIHWLPQKEMVNVEILMPNHELKKGIAEKGVLSLDVGTIIQFERFGFCRLDKKSKTKLSFWFTHK